MGWVELIYFIVAIIISVALAPKPPDAKVAAFDDFDFPIAEEGREIPVIFGEVELKGANVLWYGSLGWTKIKKRSGFSKTTIGYKYYLGIHLGLCHGPVDAVTAVSVGDKPVWSGNITANGVGGIDMPDLFGGEKQEGGIKGSFYIMMGAADQGTNLYLTTIRGTLNRLPPPHTAYRGILGFVWAGGYIGTTKYPKPWAITARRHLMNWQDGDVWYEAKLIINTKGFNGAHMIYECMTNKEWGRGLPLLRMNAVTFEAAADQLFDEDFGLRLNWNQGLTIEGFIQVILDHIAGILVWRTSTSQFELHLIRNNYVVADLFELNKSNIITVDDYQRNAWGETINELQLKYVDPVSSKDVAITVHDLANIQIQGGTNTDTVDLPGIRDHELAKRVAVRELNARSNPLAKIILTANRTAHGLYQGQVVKFSWEKLGIVDMPMRILKMNKGTLEKGRIRIEGVQDIYSLDTITYMVVPPAEDPPDDPETPVDDDDNEASVISTSLTAPPSNPADGDRYYVQPGTGTGAWAGLSGLLEWDEQAIYDVEDLEYTGAWVQVTIPPGTVIYDEENDQQVIVGPSSETEPLTIGITVVSADTSEEFEDINRVEFGNSTIEDLGGGSVLVTPESGSGGGSGGLIYSDGSAPSSNTVANTNVETAFASQYLIPLSDMALGSVLRFEARGVYGTAASAGTLRIRIKLGSVTILDTAAFTATNSLTSRGWALQGTLLITTDGLTGQVEAQGLGFFATGAATGIPIFLPNTAKVAVDISVARTFNITALWGTTNAANTITLRTFTLNREGVEGTADPILPVSLLHFEAPDASTYFFDLARKSWVRGGVTQIDTAQFKFGTASILFNGTTDYIESNSDQDFAFGAGEFTIECWVRFDTQAGNNFVFTFGAGWGVYTRINGWAVYNGAGSEVILPAGTVADDTWYHIALVRSGTTLMLFANGTLIGSVTDSTNHTASKIRLGAQPGGTGFMNGWIDEFRVHRLALYTSSFVAPAAAFTDFVAPAYEVSLLHFDAADATTVFTDEVGKTWTQGGTAEIDTAQSKFGGSSLLDPTTTSHIITPSHADFEFGTANFTIELWFRPTSLGVDQILIDGRISGSQNRPMLRTLGSGDLRYYVAGADRITSATGVLVVGTWAHIAVSRFNGNTKLFVNGTQVGSTYADLINYEACPMVIGNAGDSLGGTFGAVGHFDEVRISKGHSWYTENFLVPTESFLSPTGLQLITYDPFDGVALAAGWTALNTATFITPVVSGGAASLNFSGAADGLPHGYTQAATPTPTQPRHYRLQMGTNSSTSTQMAGIALRNSTTGNWIMLGRHQNQLGVLLFNSSNYSGTSFISGALPYENVWLEIIDDGVTLYFKYSTTGVEGSFVQVNSQLRSAFLTTVNQVFIGHFGGTSGASTLQCQTFEIRQGPV